MPSKTRHMLVQDAARALAVTPTHLTNEAKRLHTLESKDGVLIITWANAAKTVGLTRGVAELCEQGREWLMTAKDICETYQHLEVNLDKIAGSPMFETPHGKVYQVSPFLQFLLLDPREKIEQLEGKKPRGKLQNKRVRK